MVIGTFKMELIMIILLYVLDSILRLSISVLILYLFYAVGDGNKTLGFVYSVAICTLWYFIQLAKQNGLVRSYDFSSKVKSSLAMLLYSKISSLTSYSIKSS